MCCQWLISPQVGFPSAYQTSDQLVWLCCPCRNGQYILFNTPIRDVTHSLYACRAHTMFCMMFFSGPQAKYKQLLLSLGNVRNYRLVASVLAGNTTPVDLATKVSLLTFYLALYLPDFYRFLPCLAVTRTQTHVLSVEENKSGKTRACRGVCTDIFPPKRTQ